MRKYFEGAAVFFLLSLILMLSVNFAFSPAFIRLLFGASRMSYIQALVIYGVSNILFKNPIYAVKQ